jgi:putative NIF3 family GTP cyclohydrolase 1 type 2
VGDPAAKISGIALALDPTLDAIRSAQRLGANLLLTHHPAYRTPPEAFTPPASQACGEGPLVWEAISLGVALMCFHTALDVSHEAAQALPGMLGLDLMGIVEPIATSGPMTKGYGQLCTPRKPEQDLTLGQLAARCTAVFGRPPRVWGDFGRRIGRVATCTGSAGDMAKHCIASAVDCLICGEIRYHDALAAKQAGLAVIDLGHDVSELPLVAVLAAALKASGIKDDMIVFVDTSPNWAHPEALRV